MYDWLEQELALIRTPRFHVIEGRALGAIQEAISQSSPPLPKSYEEFVLRFGNAKLYRAARNGYRIGVFSDPRPVTLDDGQLVYVVGFHDGAQVLIEPDKELRDGAVWEVEAGQQYRVGNSFGWWLKEACALARERFTVEQWADILRGPQPFTPEEREIVEARRKISWHIIGVDSNGDHIFEVRNLGSRSLRVLTIGVRSRDRHLNGAIKLQIGHIGPGQKATVHADCYKELRPPEEIEVFELPEPGPEDRAFFRELR